MTLPKVFGAQALPLASAGPRSRAMTRFLKMHGLGNDFVVFDAAKARWRWTRRARGRSPTATPASAATRSSARTLGGRRRPDADLECRRRRGRGVRQRHALRRPDRREPIETRRAVGARPARPRPSTWGCRARAGPRSRSRTRWTPPPCRSAGRNCSQPFRCLCWQSAYRLLRRQCRCGRPRQARAADRARSALPLERVHVGVASIEDGWRFGLRVWERGAGLSCGLRHRRLRRSGRCDRSASAGEPGRNPPARRQP